jgi:hypothetical protein
MAELKTKPTEDSVTDFLERVADEKRRQDCFAVLDMMAEITGEPAKMWGSSIVGFGLYRYKYASGREGEWMITGFAPRKNDVTLYITGGFEPHPDLMAKLGKYSTGKGCLHIKNLDNVNRDVLKELIRKSVESVAGERITQ